MPPIPLEPKNSRDPRPGKGLVLPPNGALPSRVLSVDQPAADEVLVTDGVNSTWGPVPSAALTSVPAASLTGAIDPARLTSVPAASLTGTIAEARLPLLDMDNLNAGAAAANEVLVATSASAIDWAKVHSDNFRQNAWTAYTPALTAATTDPTLGSGSTAAGRWVRQADRQIQVVVGLIFGSGMAAGSGQYRVSLPVNAATNTANRIKGTGYLWDASAGSDHLVVVYGVAADYVLLKAEAVTLGDVTHAVPFAWAASDEIWFQISYEAAS